MTTPAQVAANRENSKLSTGPRSYKGKCKSRMNSVRHGMLETDSTQQILAGREQVGISAPFGGRAGVAPAAG